MYSLLVSSTYHFVQLQPEGKAEILELIIGYGKEVNIRELQAMKT